MKLLVALALLCVSAQEKGIFDDIGDGIKEFLEDVGDGLSGSSPVYCPKSENCPSMWKEEGEFCCKCKYYGPHYPHWPGQDDCYKWAVAIMTVPEQPPPSATSEMDSP